MFGGTWWKCDCDLDSHWQVIGLDAKGMSVMAVSSKERLHDVFQIFGMEKQLVVWALPVSS